MMDYKPEQEDTVDLEQLRTRLRKMSDAALLHWGAAASASVQRSSIAANRHGRFS